MGRRVGSFKTKKITPEQLEMQINKLVFNMDKMALDFSVDVRKRAYEVFQKSFKYHRFYSAGGNAWKELSENTIKKRTKNKTLKNGILREYETLFNSIEVGREKDGFDDTALTLKTHIARQRIFTNPKKFDVPTNPHRGFCYAGVHNNPGPNETYGNGFGGRRPRVKVVQRQFMGFSTYIDKHAEQNIDKYLFDGVFGVPVIAPSPDID